MANRWDPDAVEDITGQAGWVFSDMLVALMVVFLATITFIPQYADGSLLGGDSNVTTSIGDGKGGYTYTRHFDEAFVKIYQIVDFDTLVADKDAFLKAKKWPENSVLDSVQYVGGYDPKDEKSSVAISRASNFSAAVDAEFPGLTDFASTVLSSSPKLKGGYVLVRFTFSANISVNR